MNIILCGLPMCGKSTIGKTIAEKLGWDFIDTDKKIESLYSEKTHQIATCRDIFLNKGEQFFRSLEKEAIASLKNIADTVISLGGGALSSPDLISFVKNIGCVIYINMPIDILWERIQSSGIPAYLDQINPKDSFYSLAQLRMPIYESTADITYSPSEESERILVDNILEMRTYSNGQ